MCPEELFADLITAYHEIDILKKGNRVLSDEVLRDGVAFDALACKFNYTRHMPRKKRLRIAGEVHHVMLRGKYHSGI